MRGCGVFHCVCGVAECWLRGIPSSLLPQGVPEGPSLPLLMTLDMVTCTCKDLREGVTYQARGRDRNRYGARLDGTEGVMGLCVLSLWPLLQLLRVQEL